MVLHRDGEPVSVLELTLLAGVLTFLSLLMIVVIVAM